MYKGLTEMPKVVAFFFFYLEHNLNYGKGLWQRRMGEECTIYRTLTLNLFEENLWDFCPVFRNLVFMLTLDLKELQHKRMLMQLLNICS